MDLTIVFLIATAIAFFVGAWIVCRAVQGLCSEFNRKQYWTGVTTKHLCMLDYVWMYLAACGVGVLIEAYHLWSI